MAALHWPIHTQSPHSSIKRLFLFFLLAPLFCSFPRRFSFLPASSFLLLITEGPGVGSGGGGVGVMTPTGLPRPVLLVGGKRPLCSPSSTWLRPLPFVFRWESSASTGSCCCFVQIHFLAFVLSFFFFKRHPPMRR